MKRKIIDYSIVAVVFTGLFCWAYFAPGIAFASLFAAFTINSYTKEQ